MKFKEKVAIVTGGASGIGRATAVALAKEGARVVIADMAVESANEVVKQINGLGCEAIAVHCDITNAQQVNEMVKTALNKFGKIDILINNAGNGLKSHGAFHQLDRKVWDAGIEINLGGTFNCTRAVINHMMERRRGKIVNVASAAGVIGKPNGSSYAAAKAGIIGLTMSLAKEMTGYGINVNSVSPGPTATNMGGGPNDKRPEELKKRLADSTGWGRRSTPEEVANAIVFLASDDASFITGQNVNVGGLRTLGMD